MVINIYDFVIKKIIWFHQICKLSSKLLADLPDRFVDDASAPGKEQFNLKCTILDGKALKAVIYVWSI